MNGNEYEHGTAFRTRRDGREVCRGGSAQPATRTPTRAPAALVIRSAWVTAMRGDHAGSSDGCQICERVGSCRRRISCSRAAASRGSVWSAPCWSCMRRGLHVRASGRHVGRFDRGGVPGRRRHGRRAGRASWAASSTARYPTVPASRASARASACVRHSGAHPGNYIHGFVRDELEQLGVTTFADLEAAHARGDGDRHHARAAAAPAVGLRVARARPRRAARGRRCPRVDLDPAVLRARQAGRSSSWWTAACSRTSRSRSSTGPSRAGRRSA